MSMPAETPADVNDAVVDDAAIALHLNASDRSTRAARAPAQCVVARLPWSSPIFASSSAPVQTDVT